MHLSLKGCFLAKMAKEDADFEVAEAQGGEHDDRRLSTMKKELLAGESLQELLSISEREALHVWRRRKRVKWDPGEARIRMVESKLCRDGTAE